MKVVNKDHQKEELDEGKLWNSIYYPAREAHYTENEAVEFADKAKHQIIKWVHEHEDDTLTTEELRDKVEEVLEELDEDVEFLYRTHLQIS